MSVPTGFPTPSPQTEQTGRKRLQRILYLAIILLVVAGLAVGLWVDTMPQRLDDQQTIIVGPTRLIPGSDAAFRVVVQDTARYRPVSDAQVKVKLKPETGSPLTLFEGTTDETGSVPVSFHLPDTLSGQATLIVETRSEAGRDRVEQTVVLERDYRILITTDKPLYQPGQTIHMRALALNTFDLTAAHDVAIAFLVQDPKGNKVFRKEVPVSDMGVAAADFRLADVVIQGNYKISASIGDTASEKTVEVRPYVLPKFAVNLTTERSYYLPGEHVEGVLQAGYFFGKPVAEGQVQIVGSVWDVERTVLLEIQGQTDENGTYAFSFDLPPYFAGSGLDVAQARFVLEATVIDQAEHAEQTSLILPVSDQPIVIEAVAESGRLKPGVENLVYILTSYPDGRPAPSHLRISVDGGPFTDLDTGAFGLAEFSLTPQAGFAAYTIDLYANDEAGNKAQRQIVLEGEYGGDTVLLRSDRAAYRVGETMYLVALTPVNAGQIYLDIARAGQTLSTRSAPVREGRAEFAVDLTPDLYGTLELHAYKVLLDGSIVRDGRVVLVDAPTDLDVTITTDRDTYRPGETAALQIRTTAAADPDQGVPTVLGLAAVDESVFALQQQDPGFAKLYFLLEQELLEPFYQVKGFAPLTDTLVPEPEPIRQAQDEAMRASWAGRATPASTMLNSRALELSTLYRRQEKAFGAIALSSAVILLLALTLLAVITVWFLRRSRTLGPALVRLFGALAVLLVLFILLVALGPDEDWFLPFLLLLVAGSFLGLFIYAWLREGFAVRLFVLLVLAGGAFACFLVRAADMTFDLPPEGLLVAVGVGILAFPLVALLLGQGLWLQGRRWGGALASVLGVGLAFLILTTVSAMVVSPDLLDGRVARWSLYGLGEPVPVGLEARGPVPAPQPTPPAMKAEDTAQAGGTAGEPPRLRQYFPETLYWNPDLLTDENGFVSLNLPLADSITTWRLTALASSQDGRLGFATYGIRVFQDFFIDLDLPVALTQGDEVSIPVGVFNYLPQEQQVRLVVEQEDWFELLGPAEQTLTIASNDISVVYFPLHVLKFGRQGFQVTAWGEQMNDAIRREVLVVPDGKEFRLSQSDWLRESVEVPVEIPSEAIPGTARVEVKVYPGVMAQVVEGLEKILRLPHG